MSVLIISVMLNNTYFRLYLRKDILCGGKKICNNHPFSYKGICKRRSMLCFKIICVIIPRILFITYKYTRHRFRDMFYLCSTK